MSASSEDLDSWSTFTSEGIAGLDAAEQIALSLERSSEFDADAINVLYRAVHNLKGNARIMGLTSFERVTHLAESVIGQCREFKRLPSPAESDALLKAFDCLRVGLEIVRCERRDPIECACQVVVDELTRVVGGQEPASATDIPDGSQGVVLFDDDDEDPQGADPVACPLEPSPPVRATGPTAAANVAPVRATDDRVSIPARKVQEFVDLAASIGLAAEAVAHHPLVADIEEEALRGRMDLLDRLIRELRDAASALALVPVGSLEGRLQRALRDTCVACSKKARLEFSGEDTEVDKSLLERLTDPLMHMLRNALDHGLESPEERKAAGKPETGTVRLRATQTGGELTLILSDDGRGLDPVKIRARALARGLISPDFTADPDAARRLVFLPGFSTKEAVSEISGRGVGMDVVNGAVTALRGRIEIRSEVGKGTAFVMQLPLSLAFIDGMVVRCDERLFGFPINVVNSIQSVSADHYVQVSATKGKLMRTDAGALVPIRPLARPGGQRAASDCAAIILLIESSGGCFAVPVDEVLGTYQLTMKPLRGPLRRIPAATGCGVLGTGEVAFMLDAEEMMARHG